MNIRERAAEKRRADLLDIDQSIADGSLTSRQMTSAERVRFGIGDPDRPFRRFFFPGAKPGTRRGEEGYRRAESAARRASGCRPTARRIFRVDCSLHGSPLRLQVGETASAAGGVVTAIFELKDGAEIVVSTADEPVALRVPAGSADVLDFA